MCDTCHECHECHGRCDVRCDVSWLPTLLLLLLLRDVDRFPNDVAMTRRLLSLHPSSSRQGRYRLGSRCCWSGLAWVVHNTLIFVTSIFIFRATQHLIQGWAIFGHCETSKACREVWITIFCMRPAGAGCWPVWRVLSSRSRVPSIFITFI